MKTKTLLKLAQQNNRTLAYLARTWAKVCKSVDPVKAAVEIAEAWFWMITYLLGWFTIAAVIIAASDSVFIHHWILCSALFYLIIQGYRLSRLYLKWKVDVQDFLKAISLLERNLGSFDEETSKVDNKWYVDRQQFSSDDCQCKTLVDAAAAILRGSAGDILVLEGIGWHDGRRKELRDEFGRKLPLMNKLLGTDFTAGKFLKKEA